MFEAIVWTGTLAATWIGVPAGMLSRRSAMSASGILSVGMGLGDLAYEPLLGLFFLGVGAVVWEAAGSLPTWQSGKVQRPLAVQRIRETLSTTPITKKGWLEVDQGGKITGYCVLAALSRGAGISDAVLRGMLDCSEQDFTKAMGDIHLLLRNEYGVRGREDGDLLQSLERLLEQGASSQTQEEAWLLLQGVAETHSADRGDKAWNSVGGHLSKGRIWQNIRRGLRR